MKWQYLIIFLVISNFVLYLIRTRRSNFYRIRFHSSENEKRIEDFDSYLKQQDPDIYNRLNNEANRLGWHYVKQWRAMGYSNYAPMLLILRLNNLRKSVMGKYRVQIDRIPKHLMRQTV